MRGITVKYQHPSSTRSLHFQQHWGYVTPYYSYVFQACISIHAATIERSLRPIRMEYSWKMALVRGDGDYIPPYACNLQCAKPPLTLKVNSRAHIASSVQCCRQDPTPNCNKQKERWMPWTTLLWLCTTFWRVQAWSIDAFSTIYFWRTVSDVWNQ